MCSSTFLFNSKLFSKINLLKFQFSLVLSLVLQTETEKLGGLIVFPSLFFFFLFFVFFFFQFLCGGFGVVELFYGFFFYFLVIFVVDFAGNPFKMSRLAFPAGCIEVDIQLHRRRLTTFDYSPS